jgi:hypothetical protein
MNVHAGVEAQPEFMPWGNLLGIRVAGELVPFETSVRAVRLDWSGYTQSSKYNWEGQQTFRHDAEGYEASHALEGLPVAYRIAAHAEDDGRIELTVRVHLQQDLETAGLFFCLAVPAKDFGDGQLDIVEGQGDAGSRRLTADLGPVSMAGRGVCLRTPAREIECVAEQTQSIILRQDATTHPAYLNDPRSRQDFAMQDARGVPPDFQFYFPLAPGRFRPGQVIERRYWLRAHTVVDQSEVKLVVDATRPGQSFHGIGGNFRLQFPDKDPAVIGYCLDHLRVAWGRIAMYWRDWHPVEDEDPVARARAGQLSDLIRRQMEVARTLAQRGIPVIVSVWDPPRWAVRPWPDGGRGEELRAEKLPASAQSITDYLVYLKEQYGVEAELFSFNETDVGVEVRETAAQHAAHARVFGTAFAARGLKTRMLLGDTGHGTVQSSLLIAEVIKDPAARSRGGAVAFHTYHGCTPPDLTAWAAVSRKLDLPLMVTEGGPDSAAHRYPQIFLQPWFAMQEVDAYVRIAAACQPATIMPWQLTSDYSVLAGGGIYGDAGPLRPTQRFWNLKQFGATPAGSRWLPVTCDRPNVSGAAFAAGPGGGVGLHLVNNGATRPAVVRGLPPTMRTLRVFCTDATRGMEEMDPVAMVNGEVRVILPAGAFVSLFGDTDVPANQGSQLSAKYS